MRALEPGVLALAVVSYVPLLLTHVGKVGADTKQYLYLDPGQLMGRSVSMWDPGVGLGTVTHQNIGYLFPMGPYYWLMEAVGVPDWVAQRLWMGTILFAAGMGVRALFRSLAWTGPGRTVAMFAYAFSPYVLHYVYKHSVILLPFAALPWLLHFTIRAIRRGGWRDPAWFALVTLITGGINATSLLLVMLGPFLWVLHALVVEREITLRKVLPPLLRIGVLTLATSLWWMAGLLLQGRYGIDILAYTETYQTVSNASSATEVVRGLGYWFFYGTDALGPWFESAVTMTESVPAVALSFAIPILALAAALWTRWRYRVFFVGMAVVGLVVSVGAYPFDEPSPYGSLFAAWTRTSSGLAFRSTPRALPLLALALAVFLGAGVAAIAARRPSIRLVPAVGAILLVLVNLSPMWTGDLLDAFLERGGDVPGYWREAADDLSEGDHETRALEIPGIEFASYRWGSTVDPITPGLTDRPYAARELVPWGSPPSADLTNAVDAPFQDGSYDPAGFATLMRLLGVGDVVARNDIEYERYRSPRPRILTAWLDRTPGLGNPRKYGPAAPNRAVATNPMIDDVELAIPDDARHPAAVEIRSVQDPADIVRLLPARDPVVLAGSGAGIVAAADAGVIDASKAIFYSGDVSDERGLLDDLLRDGATLVVTDSNRKAAVRWGALRETRGYTETADEEPPYDPTDNRLPLFGERSTDPATQTVVEHRGDVTVRASGYGNELTYTPGDRAAGAVDGDLSTSWKVAAFADPRGEWIEVSSTTGPITTDQIRVVQAQNYVNRRITDLDLSFDGGAAERVRLDESSHSDPGQVLRFEEREFTTVRLTIRGTDVGPRDQYRGISGVGFAEIDLDGRTMAEVVRPPTDLLDAVARRAADHRVVVLLSRLRSNPAEPVVRSDELQLLRVVDLPVPLRLGVSGMARLSSLRSDSQIDELLGRAMAGVTINSSGRLNGDLAHRGSAAFDGDETTSWQSSIGDPAGHHLEWSSPAPRTWTVEELVVSDDDRHSVPTSAHLVVDGQAGPSFRLDPTGNARSGRLRLQPADGPLDATGSTVRLVFDELDQRTQPDWLTKRPIVMPVEVAEVAISEAGQAVTLAGAHPGRFDSGCRDDLLTVDGTAVPLRVTGSTQAAQSGMPLDVEGCEAEVDFARGRTEIRSERGATTGIDLDRVVLDSGEVTSAAAAPEGDDEVSERLAQVRIVDSGRTWFDLALGGLDRPGWLVLGQSLNDGWKLTADGVDLGPPRLISGYANGWLLDPSELGRDVRLELRWTPQRTVWIALALSGAGLVLCGVLAFRRRGPEDPNGRVVPLRPRWIGLVDGFGNGLPWVTTAVCALAAGAATWIVVTPAWWAILVGLLTGAAARWGRAWALLRFTSLGLLGLAAAFVVARQVRSGIPVDFDWPLRFSVVNPLVMSAFVLLAAEAVIEALRAGWRRDTGLDG